MTYVRVNLKVCELCGVNYLRVDESKSITCAKCAVVINTAEENRQSNAGVR